MEKEDKVILYDKIEMQSSSFCLFFDDVFLENCYYEQKVLCILLLI